MMAILLHTDQGNKFTSYLHHKQSKAMEFLSNMSRRANYWDNAVMESVFSHYKTEYELHYPMNNYTSKNRFTLILNLLQQGEKQK
ncbi:hypothetical protein AC739_19130 [Planococcus glaciei]|nr:hypothetical protein AC739_19130 [Planococcus glaciei]